MPKNLLNFIILLLLLLALAYQQYCIHQLKGQLASLQTTTDTQYIRIQADEAYIQGDSALAYQLFAGLGDSLLERRKAAVPREYTPKTDFRQMASGNGHVVKPSPVQDQITALIHTIDSLQHVLQGAQGDDDPVARNDAESTPADFQQKDFLQFPSAKKGEPVNFLGEIRNGKANGKGVAVWKNGSTYQGDWKDNLRHGRGVFTWVDGEKYSGEYRNDLRHGEGVYTAKTGERYEGEWADDKRHGEGRLYDKQGKLRLRGIWKADKLVKTIKEY